VDGDEARGDGAVWGGVSKQFICGRFLMGKKELKRNFKLYKTLAERATVDCIRLVTHLMEYRKRANFAETFIERLIEAGSAIRHSLLWSHDNVIIWDALVAECKEQGERHNTDRTYLDVEISTVVKTSPDNNKLDSGTLEYSARWIENSLVGETNERVVEFGKNMAMSIRAARSSNIDDTCPNCDGAGELAGDYFAEDGIITCGRCNGKGTI
jgi:hypothetical protein